MSQPTKVIDYASSGATIQFALVDQAKRFPDKKVRPKHILWDGIQVKNSDSIPVPNEGVVRAEFLHANAAVRQGFDLELDKGWLELADQSHVPLLRTWRDDRYEDVVEYPFFSRDGLFWTWNVYEMTYPSGEKREEKWTGNAGFWVEIVNDHERIYHCSHGMASPPDFDSLVYKLTVRPR